MPEYVEGYGNRLPGSGPYLDEVDRPGSADAYVESADLESWPLYVYGNSYGVLAAPYFSSGRHYSQLASHALGGGPSISYAVSGRRIIDVCSTLINGTAFPGCNGVNAAGIWSSTTARQGLVILESLINDIGHYPAMNVGVAIPAALSAANNRYRDSLKEQYRAALALMSSESRVSQTARTGSSGVWTHDSVQLYAYGGSVSFTSAAAAYIEYTITPPQSGPFKGKVFHTGFALDPSLGAMAQQQISVDGVLQTTRTPSGTEQYTGYTGVQVSIAPDFTAVTLPVDGAAHVIRVTHSAAGFLYSNGIVIPSTNPNPIAVMGAEHALVGAPTWNAVQTSLYHGNHDRITSDIQSVVAEFPNAFWVPSTLTSQGIYSADGIHPNDKGMAQRATDLKIAVNKYALPRLQNRIIASGSSSKYPIL